VRASTAPDDRLQPDLPRCYAIVEWGLFQLVSEAEALEAIAADGVPLEIGRALVGKAPMPLACS
jgi:hypothetical protein